jgi:hypothetical protein
MTRIDEIQNAMMGLVGWEQSFNPADAIDDELTNSESGLYYQNAHPLLTLDNIKAIIPETFTFQYPEWNNTTEYKVGDKVKHLNQIYIAIADNVAETPANGSVYWSVYNFLSDYLIHLTKNGIATTVQQFIQMKGLQQETKNLLERRTFFDGAGRINATIENRGKLVGFEIEPVRSMGVTAKIERIGLQMKGGTGIVKMYLFHSSQVDPIKTFELNFTNTNGGFQWFNIADAYMPYISDANNSGGCWFLCYNQNDLPAGMEAINVSKDWSREPCGTCNIGSLETWRELTKYMLISPFCTKAPTTFAEYPELWDIEQTNYTNTINYGLNVEITVGCDLTDFIIEQRQMFATVLQRQVAAIALRTMALNPDVRVNRNQSNVSKTDVLMYELDGNSQGRPNGLGYELKQAYKALSLNTQNLDRICLTCNNHGVKYRTV